VLGPRPPRPSVGGPRLPLPLLQQLDRPKVGRQLAPPDLGGVPHGVGPLVVVGRLGTQPLIDLADPGIACMTRWRARRTCWELAATPPLPFLVALLLERLPLEFAGVFGMGARGGGPVGAAEALLQHGRPLVQLDRAGVRYQLAALGQGGPDASAGGVLVGQVVNALQGLVLDLVVPAHGWSAILSKPTIRLAAHPQHGGSRPIRQPGDRHRPAKTGEGRVWLAQAEGGTRKR
jgi:hypothetical protein